MPELIMGLHRPANQNFASTPRVVEDTITTGTVQIERKTFVFAVKENSRGRFLRITEDAGGRRNTLIIPATGLQDFISLFEEMQKTSLETPPKQPGG